MVTPRTAVANKTLDAEKKNRKLKEIERETGEHGTGRDVSGAPRACAHVHPPQFPSHPAHVDFDAHDVSTACACYSIPQHLSPSSPPRHQPQRGHGHGMGIIICQHHHGVPTSQRERESVRICRCGRGRQRRECGDDDDDDDDGDPGDARNGWCIGGMVVVVVAEVR